MTPVKTDIGNVIRCSRCNRKLKSWVMIGDEPFGKTCAKKQEQGK